MTREEKRRVVRAQVMSEIRFEEQVEGDVTVLYGFVDEDRRWRLTSQGGHPALEFMRDMITRAVLNAEFQKEGCL